MPDAAATCPTSKLAGTDYDTCAGNPSGSHFQDVCSTCADCVPYGPAGHEVARCVIGGSYCLEPCSQDSECAGGRTPEFQKCVFIKDGCFCSCCDK